MRFPYPTVIVWLLAVAVRGQSLDQANIDELVTVAPANEVVVDLRNAPALPPTPVKEAVKETVKDSPKPAKEAEPAPNSKPAKGSLQKAATTKTNAADEPARGKASAERTPEAAPPKSAAAPAAVDEAAPRSEPPAGVTAEVTAVAGERVANLDPAKVKIRAPFPAKPLVTPPAGWKIARSKNPKSITRDVELAPGKRLTLRIQPHVLVPDANGVDVLSVAEPGHDPAAFYQQTATIAGILAQSVEQSTTAERRLTIALDQLDQLLVSLPKTKNP